MTEPTERERETACKIVLPWLHGSEEHRQWLRDIAEPDIAKALAESREEGRREERARCAAVARAHPVQPPYTPALVRDQIAYSIERGTKAERSKAG